MHPTWQLLERHAATLDAERLLWVDPPEPHALIKPGDALVTPDRSVYASRPGQALTPDDPWPDDLDGLVLFHPKARGRLEWWLARLGEAAGRASIRVVGENQSGIKSLARRVRDSARVGKIDSARHCVLLDYQPLATGPAGPGWHSFEYDTRRVYALPGVFSQNRLDTGTAVLLDHLPALGGEVLELGCGSGVIGLDLLGRSATARLTAVDLDWLALASARRTLEEAGLLDRAELIWSDGPAEVPPRRFDALVSNPPFHTGLRTHYEPSERFFAASGDWLKPGGELWWVANDFLDYRRNLASGRFNVDEIAHERGFRVYRAVLKKR